MHNANFKWFKKKSHKALDATMSLFISLQYKVLFNAFYFWSVRRNFCDFADPKAKVESGLMWLLILMWQELKKLGLGSEVDLHVSEVPVEYQTVQSLVPALWKQYCPLVRQELVPLTVLASLSHLPMHFRSVPELMRMFPILIHLITPALNMF